MDLKSGKKRKTSDLDVCETNKRKHILDGFELRGTQQRAVGSAGWPRVRAPKPALQGAALSRVQLKAIRLNICSHE